MSNLTAGTHKRSRTYLSDAAITERYRFVELGSDGEHVAVCNALSDTPLGIVADTAAGAEAEVSINLLGLQEETQRIIAGETIAPGDLLITGTNGRAVILPSDPGAYYIVGRAITGGDVGEIVEIVTTFPIQRIVS